MLHAPLGLLLGLFVATLAYAGPSDIVRPPLDGPLIEGPLIAQVLPILR